MQFARPAGAGILAALLLTAAGCSPSNGKPGAEKARTSGTKPAPADELAALPISPAAEFQHPPVPPPREPLPKPTLEPIDQPAVPATHVPPPSTKPQLAEPSNPLRDTRPPAGESYEAGPPKQQASPPAEPAAPPNEPAAPPAGRPQTKKNSGKRFNPIDENGEIFVEGSGKTSVPWPKPKVALVITGMEEGYLEPCGCAGLDRMQGGMGRRYSLFQELRKKGWPVVGLDVGGLVPGTEKGFGYQAELKFQTAVESKRAMGYDAIAFGANDLRLPADHLFAMAAGVDDKPSIFVSANVGILGKPGENTSKSRVIEAGGKKIGVTAVLGKEYQKDIHNADVELSDPVAALETVVPELKQKADFLVLLAHATMEESLELARRFPQFNVVVASDGESDPPKSAQTIEGTKTLLITVGDKGRNVIVLGLYDDAQNLVRDQRVPLDSRFLPAPEMKALMAVYQDQLKEKGLAGLGLRPVAHPLSATNGRFIGSKKCGESCHEPSYNVWKKTLHAHAYDTLAKLDPPRSFDPECISCHVVGWHPTKFFPYQFGFENLNKTPHLINVGCEDCHGPGEKHAAVELSGSEADREKFRKAVVITKAESKKQQCISCHDGDNSPEFDFDKYWPFVEHHEKE